MNYKSKTKKIKSKKIISCLLISGMLLSIPTVSSKAAVITSNATDKVAVVFNENTAYSAGDYITYEGEMYICTEDIQGTWSTAKEGFMQITKNHELGQSEELSTIYDDSKDPSGETSLMAFAANAWQKLKGFLGIGNGQQDTDPENYKHASVSAKLNYLERQNRTLTQNLSNLQGSVDRSFQSVSNGKNLLTNAITGKGGTASSSYTFQEFSQAIDNLAQAQYQAGAAFADGRVNPDSASYQAGIAFADGRVNQDSVSYQAGITFADGRVNPDSASYQAGVSQSGIKQYAADVKLSYNGPDSESDAFLKETNGEVNTWKFHKVFEGHTIVGVYYKAFIVSPYESFQKEQTGVLTFSGFRFSEDIAGLKWVVASDTVFLGDFQFSSRYIDNQYVTLKINVMYI